MSSDGRSSNSATNAVTGILKIIHGSGDAVRGHINALVDGAGEKLAGRKGTTPVSASGERAIEVAERGVEEFKEGIAALKGTSYGSIRRSTGSARSSPPKSPSTSLPHSPTGTAATVVGNGSPARRIPPPLHPQTEPVDGEGGYHPDATELRDNDVEGGANNDAASVAPSDSTTTTTRALYGSLDGHGNTDNDPVFGKKHYPTALAPPTEEAASSSTTGGEDVAMVQSPTRMESYTSGNTIYASAEDVSTAHAVGSAPPLPPRSHA